jgi:hypothetical protein
MSPHFRYLLLIPVFFSITTAEEKSVTLRRFPNGIAVDGSIDAQWSLADSVSDFFQLQPFYGKEPSRRTVAKVLTTDDALYSLIVCEDVREDIQAFAGKLDQSSGDLVSIMLDTFGDKRTAYKFAVSASGVRSDCRLLDDARNRDYTWDGVWFAASKIYDWGFVVEIEIPYRTIQYDKRLSSWGLDFDRWKQKGSEDVYWCHYDEMEGQRVSKFGQLLFKDFQPSVEGLNLEIYPVGIVKATYLRPGVYTVAPTAGIDVFYNPSAQLTFQLTANPDFAQIEADPFSFNISRYESYFEERRLFFIQGKEIFTASGRQRNTGFYSPLELFYSRRIGKKLPSGDDVPIIVGTKAFGRIADWEYGGFLTITGTTDYTLDGADTTEPQAYFASARLSRQIFENSTVGVLYVGKHTSTYDNGLVDIDGAFRTSDLQLAYQVARSYYNDWLGSSGDFAGSAGLIWFRQDWLTGIRARYIGDAFEVNQVGFIPWKGTGELVALTGPRWYFDDGYIKSITIYGGGILNYEKVDAFTDRSLLIGYNMQFRDNWGFEINVSGGPTRDQEKEFNSFEASFSSWFNTSPRWHLNAYGGYSKTYNFSRDYLAFFSWLGSDVEWNTTSFLELGTTLNGFIEGNPSDAIEDITYNARPFLSVTPVNDLNFRIYLDVVCTRSSQQVQNTILGFLFSYNFLPKSWIYLAINEYQQRSDITDALGATSPGPLAVTDRVGVLKVRYLYYF